MGEKIMLLDGNSLINRAFYGIPVLTNKAGEFTNAVFGFINIFQKLYNEEAPNRVAVAFDLPAPTFRHKLYSEYKGTRKSMPPELRPQIGTLKALLKLMNIPVVELEGFEADDILGSLSLAAEEAGFDVTLVSGDKDLLQIASDKTKIRIPKTKGGKTEVEDYYAADLFTELGLTPSEYIDLKALMGDSSDNIPGVPGIGEKTALKIITEYRNIEAAIENADKIMPKRASENLKIYAEQARLSRTLAEINRHAPVPPLPDAIKRNEIFNASAREEILRLEFRSLLTLFEQGEKKAAAAAVVNYKTISSKNELSEYLAKLCSADKSALRLVCDSGRLLGAAFCIDETSAVFATAFGELDEDELLNALKPYFEGESQKICYDLKGELTFLSNKGISLNNAVFDLMLAAYILDASAGLDYSAIAYDYLNETMQSPEEFFGKGKNRTEITAISNDNERLEKFACGQAYTIFAAHKIMAERIERNNQHELYYSIELPLVYVLRDMERLGIKIDRQAIAAFGEKLDIMLASITSEIYIHAGEEFNIASPKQLGVILFEKLGLKSGKKTKTGYSTSAEVLNELIGKHPIAPLILEYRTYSKLKSTYVDGLLAVAKDDDKIYSTFNQLVTATGRISSTEPNLQNIPIRYELGRELRKVFIPSSEDYVFLDADYSQIELRILAHLSGDETFINAFKHGEDIHRLTASQVFGLPHEFISPEQRSNAKAVNFGIVYGISAFSLSQDLSISVKEAQRYIDGYFERYPRVRVYLDDIVNSAKSKGYAETLFNRRREIPELKSSNFAQRAFGERAAMNMPVQGTAADIIKIAMVGVSRRLIAEGLKSRLILQVHDELLIEAHKDEIPRVSEILKYEMENAANLLVPIDAELKQGNNWFEAH